MHYLETIVGMVWKKCMPSKRNGHEVMLSKNDTINVISPNENKSTFTQQNVTALDVGSMRNAIIGYKVKFSDATKVS